MIIIFFLLMVKLSILIDEMVEKMVANEDFDLIPQIISIMI